MLEQSRREGGSWVELSWPIAANDTPFRGPLYRVLDIEAPSMLPERAKEYWDTRIPLRFSIAIRSPEKNRALASQIGCNTNTLKHSMLGLLSAFLCAPTKPQLQIIAVFHFLYWRGVGHHVGNRCAFLAFRYLWVHFVALNYWLGILWCLTTFQGIAQHSPCFICMMEPY